MIPISKIRTININGTFLHASELEKAGSSVGLVFPWEAGEGATWLCSWGLKEGMEGRSEGTVEVAPLGVELPGNVSVARKRS